MTTRPDSYTQRLRNWCTQNSIEQPQWQDYSDPRGIRTAWSSSVIVSGREYRATLWRDYRYLDQSREEAAEVAYRAITGGSSSSQYSYPGYSKG
ncbi:hypothetical protein EJ04DRAFT_515169 [Polyplosphaeria fusca]|uniref:Uncharacterized protein n=1 Tax=Polyplosphaeria fusca TaxID=682080 RepID=A0A9P4UXQ6_9PLEO|nr:hypothetical protein EJ04DRAFT_515169 [Polyplosphaeria fusca]